MINEETIRQQMDMTNKSVDELKKLSANFEHTMSDMVKKAPKEHQQQLEAVRVMTVKALNLAKQGKNDEAQQIIKDFQNGSKNS